MFNRIVKIPFNFNFFKIDLDELEAYVERRYHETFGEPPLEVEATKYPGEIDIVFYTSEHSEQKSEFRAVVQRELKDMGLPVLIVMKTRTHEKG